MKRQRLAVYNKTRKIKHRNVDKGEGFLYDWMFVMQNPQAFSGSSWNPGCTNNPGTKAACRGICPEGWHVPTGNSSTGEFTLLNNAENNGSTTSPAGLLKQDGFRAVYGGWANPDGSLGGLGTDACYWTSSFYTTSYAYHLRFSGSYVYPARDNGTKYYGFTLRCVRNLC